MAKAAQKTIEEVGKELDEHFSKLGITDAKKSSPDALVAVKFDCFPVDGFAMVQLPYRADTVEFGIAARSIRQEADKRRIHVLFFDSRQQYEAFDIHSDLALARFGLMRIPGAAPLK